LWAHIPLFALARRSFCGGAISLREGWGKPHEVCIFLSEPEFLEFTGFPE